MFVTHLRDLLRLHCNLVFDFQPQLVCSYYQYKSYETCITDAEYYFHRHFIHIISISSHPENGKLKK